MWPVFWGVGREASDESPVRPIQKRVALVINRFHQKLALPSWDNLIGLCDQAVLEPAAAPVGLLPTLQL